MVYRFGELRLDTGARQLLHGTTPIHLTKKAFELLTLLAERQPNVVAKDEIHTRLWPDTFVAESSIQALISEIRHAVGEKAHQRSWIRTVHGVGYALRGATEEREQRTGEQEARAWLLAESWRVPLYEGDNVLGRGSHDVVAIDASGVSRRHARIVIGNDATIEDLGSKNGTWVRDERVHGRMPLSDGDAVRFGSLLFTFRFSRGVDSTDTQAPLKHQA